MHVPKTGGTWATQALLNAGVPCRKIEASRRDHYNENGHVWLADLGDAEKLVTVAFVRHPLLWWRSFWAHRMREGWPFPDHEIDSHASSEDFDEFIAMVVEQLPGFLGVLFERFIGPEERPIDFIGRHEHIADDLSRALKQAGEPFDEVALRATPPQNVGVEEWLRVSYTPELAHALIATEHRVINRFYADDPTAQRLLG
jgi:hypothetical protein